MEIVFSRVARYLYNAYLEHGIKSLDDEHDCNVASINSLNIFDASDMPSHKLGDATFDEYDIFSPPSFDEQNYYDSSMPPIYDDYCDDMLAMHVHHEKGDVGDG